ncbi:MAG: helix-turn-helix transcriptional regulator [Propioniciclava sp.]
MRADRLVSVLLLLQRRGQMTATEVAAELEVSPRTARRDLEALGTAGLPVYSVAGRGGGWRLLGEGRTDLSGLSVAEASALFALVGVAGAHQPPETAAALRKLSRALPAPIRDAAERAATSIRTAADPHPGRARVPAPRTDADILAAVRHSLVQQRRADLTYRGRDGRGSRRVLDPLGLVARGSQWYLVAMTSRGQRTFRVDRIEDYLVREDASSRPEGFDLDKAWSDISAGIDDLRWATRARVMISAEKLGLAQFHLADRLLVAEPPDGAHPAEIAADVRGWSLAELVTLLAGLHPWVRVTGPAELQDRLAALGESLVAMHRTCG